VSVHVQNKLGLSQDHSWGTRARRARTRVLRGGQHTERGTLCPGWLQRSSPKGQRGPEGGGGWGGMLGCCGWSWVCASRVIRPGRHVHALACCTGGSAQNEAHCALGGCRDHLPRGNVVLRVATTFRVQMPPRRYMVFLRPCSHLARPAQRRRPGHLCASRGV